MLDFFSRLFASDFMPHGDSYSWSPALVWLHVISDALITLAYYSIPLTLIYIVRKRRDVPFPAMYLMFGGFIVACGTTHLMEIWNVWHGTYRLAGVIKATTALISVFTAIALVKLVPAALTLRSLKEVEAANAALAREITERKRSEAALEHERHLLCTLMNNLPDRIFFKDRESRFLRNNRAHLERLGLQDQAQAVGKTNHDFYPEAYARRALEDEQRVIATGRTFNQEVKMHWPDGQEDWSLITKMPLLDQNGQVIGTFGIARDITDLKRSETELRRAQEGLELRVQQRTQELEEANTILQREITERQRAELALKESVFEKETLLKETHHRVKNNLQLISSLLQLQSGYVKDPAALGHFRESQSRIRSMALIHEKLYHSGSLARIDMAEYVRSLTSMLVHTYHTHDSKVSLQLRIQSVSLNLDTAVPLGLVLNELISNCLEHAFPDQRSGVIRVALSQADDGQLTLVVEDDGVGLPENINPEASSSLGLRLIHILAEQLHGAVNIRRQGGTAVTLTAYELQTKERS